MLDTERRQLLRQSGQAIFGVLADHDAVMANLTGRRVRAGDADERERLSRSGETVFRVLADHDAIVGHMSDALAGYPTGHVGSGEGDGLVDDKARKALIEFTKDVRELHRVTAKLEEARMHWGRGEYVPERMLRDPGCEVIERVSGGKIYEPTHRSSNVGGRLPKAMRLGIWAYEFVQRYGDPTKPSTDALPTDDEVRAHLQGRRVRRRETKPPPRTPTVEGESWVEHTKRRSAG